MLRVVRDVTGMAQPTTAARPILVCVVAILVLGTWGIVGMLTKSLDREMLALIAALISGATFYGSAAHMVAAERMQTRLLEGRGIGERGTDRQPAPPAQP